MTVLLGAKALAQTWLSALVVVILVVSTTVTAGTSSWIRTVSLQDFNDHFEWNSFCVASTPNAAVETPQVDVYKDLITGEIKLKDDSHDGQHDLSLGGSSYFRFSFGCSASACLKIRASAPQCAH